MSVRIEVIDGRGGELPRRAGRALRAIARAALAATGYDGVVVSLALADDTTVQALNRDYRGKDRPTNVLSFPGSGEPPTPHGRLIDMGEVVIAPAVVAAEATAAAMDPELRLAHLVIHGILHLAGYDHERSAAEARRQETAEAKLLEQLDPGDVRALARLF